MTFIDANQQNFSPEDFFGDLLKGGFKNSTFVSLGPTLQNFFEAETFKKWNYKIVCLYFHNYISLGKIFVTCSFSILKRKTYFLFNSDVGFTF